MTDVMPDGWASKAQELEDSLPIYTVCGIWPLTRERWLDHFHATSARQAEDLARQMAAEKGGELWVSNIFEGKLTAVDTYAIFSDDPDKTTQAEE